MPGGRGRLRLTLWLGLLLTWGAVQPGSGSAQEAGRGATNGGSGPKTIYYKNRSFRIPVTIPQDAIALVREVRLWVSDDSGYHWKALGRTRPDRPEFPFRSAHDGEFWFAIQTVDMQGKVYPADDNQVEPSLKVVIDTAPPTIVLEPGARKGSQASVRWEIQDENLVLRSFALEYQPEGAGAFDWRSVPLNEEDLRMAGTKTWDAGTSEAIRVRASVMDRARNTRQAETSLSDGLARRPGSASSRNRDSMGAPPPVAPISSRRASPSNDPFDPPDPFAPQEADPGFDDEPEAASETASEFDSATSRRSAGATGPGREPSLLVGNPRFPLQYEVEGVGPGGVAKVQLWVTNDGGRSWFPQAEDPDRSSPYAVDLRGEGTFGLWLCVQGTSGLGDPPPGAGDKPQSWVEVDTTPPIVQIDPPRVGTNASMGKVLITWRASDPHLAARPVILSYRAEETEADWTRIAGPLENNGQFIWAVPPGVPPRFRIRIEVVDSVGHKGFAESAPILVDRARPKARILGLDPGSARAAAEESRR